MPQAHDKQRLFFDHDSPTRVVFGNNAVDQIGHYVSEWGPKCVLLVTDKHIVEAGHAPRVKRDLEELGVQVVVYDEVHENPTTDDVSACLAVARTAPIDTIIGLGGGSSMDTAKGCNFVLTNGEPMHQYHGVDKAKDPLLPLVAIPTTAGTGSECQSFALIADAKTHMKMACGDPKAAPRVSILDPTLTVTQPRNVTANTGVDALSHAVETAVTTRRNELSLTYSREAFRLIVAHFDVVLEEPDNLESRGQMLLAAAYAGTAIQNSMLGAVHATANPLSAKYDTVHGQAVGVMMPAVVRFNAKDPDTRDLYHDLAVHAGLTEQSDDPATSIDAIVTRITELLQAAGLQTSLHAMGVPKEDIPALADLAATQWTGNFNPRPVKQAEFEKIYCDAM
ncbi:MAG: iron-containing alcohol dehydrogenase [Planctomycetota bacterium]|jgi:alcohol dehydrogenase